MNSDRNIVASGNSKHVTIIGSGIIGLASALWLQKAGHRVTIIDREPPLPGNGWQQAASFGNACTIAPQGVVPIATPGIARQVPGMLMNPQGPLAIVWRYLPQLTPWLAAFIRAGRQAEVERIAGVLARLLAEANAGWNPLFDQAGARHLLHSNGCLYLYDSAAALRAGEYGTRLRERHAVRLQRLDAAEVHELEPGIARRYYGGVLFEDAYTVSSPRQLGQLLAAAFCKNDGMIVTGEAENIRPTPDGVTFSVNGADRMTGHLVICSGAWSRRLTRQCGDDILLDTERGYHVLFPDGGNLINRPVCLMRNGFYMTPMADGLRAAGTVELGGLQAPPNPQRHAAIIRGVRDYLPMIGRPETFWMGFRPSMPDSLPVIGNSPRNANITYAFGHGHLGLTLAGVTGRLVGELVSGIAPHIDLHDLRPDRFNRRGGKNVSQGVSW